MTAVRAGLVLIALAGASFAQDPWKQANGLVPDKEAAIKIAEAILFPIYGERKIKQERPYHVTLTNGCWVITGSMPEAFLKEPVFGGTFYILISQWDARVIKIGHDE